MIDEKLIEKIEKATEAEHYFIIEECGGFIFHMNHEMMHGRIPEDPGILEDIKNVRELQEYVVSKLDKFGVDITDPKSKTDRKNGSYWKWYDFWHEWHHNKLSNEEWKTVNERMKNEEDFSEFLPKEKWNN
jgi:hypothetical protein